MGRDEGFNNGKPLGVPALRIWDLNENSTRYDMVLAAPSDETLRIMWILFASFFFFFTAIMLVVFMAIITNKKVRANSFNLYLIFLMVPDIIFTTLCASNCAWLAANDGFKYEWVCNFQSFYLMFGIAANAWLNGIIAYEVHTMLVDSNAGKRYFPPARSRVVRNAMLAYLWAIFVGLWGVVSVSWLPHESNARHGITCTPLEYSMGSTIFFWVVFIPALCLIPLAYGAYATVMVARKKLLPPTGRRRELAIYFFRIMFVFIIMWCPFVVIVFVAGGTAASPWVIWSGGLWSHMQGPVSAAVSCFKTDIRKAVLDFIYCKKVEHNDEQEGSSRSITRWIMARSGRSNRSWLSPSAASMRYVEESTRPRSAEAVIIGEETLESESPADTAENSEGRSDIPPKPKTRVDLFNENSTHFLAT